MSNATDLDRQKILRIDRNVVLELLRARSSAADVIAVPDVKIPDGTEVVSVHYEPRSRQFEFALLNPDFPAIPVGEYLPRIDDPLEIKVTQYRAVGASDCAAQERAARNYHDAAVALGHLASIKQDPRDRTWQVRVYNAGGGFIKEFSFYPDGQCAAFSQSAPVLSRWDGK